MLQPPLCTTARAWAGTIPASIAGARPAFTGDAAADERPVRRTAQLEAGLGFELVISGVAGALFAMPLIREAFGFAGARSISGVDSLIGATGTVLPPDQPGEPSRWILVRGERWQVRSPVPLEPNSLAQVDAVQGLELLVSPTPEPTARQPAPQRYRTSPRWWAGASVVWAASVLVALLTSGSVVGAVFLCPAAGLVVLLSLGGFADLG